MPQDEGGRPSSYPNVNLSTLLSTSADWSSCASGWRMDTRTLLTVAWWILCRAHRTEMATAVTLVASRPSTGWGPGGQRGCSAGGGVGARDNRWGSGRVRGAQAGTHVRRGQPRHDSGSEAPGFALEVLQRGCCGCCPGPSGCTRGHSGAGSFLAGADPALALSSLADCSGHTDSDRLGTTWVLLGPVGHGGQESPLRPDPGEGSGESGAQIGT